jgi:hypothetical protein
MSATNRSGRLCGRAVMLTSLAGAFVGLMAGLGPASARPEVSDLAGRWVSAVADAKEACGEGGCRLVYDLVPCGKGWCGIEVKDDKTCGRTALRLDAGASTQYGVIFFGSFERAPATQPYSVKVQLYTEQRSPPQGRLMLFVQGSTDSSFQPLRRTYPMQMLMSRAGDTACRDEASTS